MGGLRRESEGSGGLRIRAADAEDVQAVMALMKDTPEAPQWRREVLEAYVGGDVDSGVAKGLIVAQGEEKLAGFVAGTVMCGIAELECIVVEEKARGKGLGRRMLEALAQWAKTLGAESMELEVRASNETALKLYEALGFAETARRRGYYREPAEDAVLMTWHL